jgi:hypothetical protein
MNQLPVIQRTKLTKQQTYFVNASDISKLLSDCSHYDNLELRFCDDPSPFKSNYDRFVKKEGKLVILSGRYTPSAEDQAEEGESRNYRVSVFAILKTIREELIAQFQEQHFETLRQWLNEPRDKAWCLKPHAIQFLIDIDTEKIVVAHDIDFDSYSRH